MSWKEGDTLWIKASGTSLRAADPNVFIPVSLGAAVKGHQPRCLSDTDHRPSIETRMHAVIPHRVVVHLHAVDILAYLVRADWVECTHRILAGWTNFSLIPYAMPGDELALRIREFLSATTAPVDVFLLQNHGVVVGGQTVAEVDATLSSLVGAFASNTDARSLGSGYSSATGLRPPPPLGYQWVSDDAVSRLMIDPALAQRVALDWALYPDHVVFLGALPTVVDAIASRSSKRERLLFVRGAGVAVTDGWTQAQQEQLVCYADVLGRIPPTACLNVLSDAQIRALIGWEAEEHRQRLAEGSG